jgi:translation initiation factor 3 subunit B
MAAVLTMAEIESKAASLGIDLSTIDFDSIVLPSGEDFGIKR